MQLLLQVLTDIVCTKIVCSLEGAIKGSWSFKATLFADITQSEGNVQANNFRLKID